MHSEVEPARPAVHPGRRPPWMDRVLPTGRSALFTAFLWLPMLGWLLLFQPGMISPDSLNIWRQVVTGRWSDAHPPLYTAALWVSHALVGTTTLLAAAQGLLLAAAVAACARALHRTGVPKAGLIVVASLLCWSPMVGAFSVSIWKDVPYAAAFLFAAARTVDLVDARLRCRSPQWPVVALTGWSILLVLLRQNGVVLVAVLVASLLLAVPDQRRRLVASLVTTLAVLVFAKAVLYPALGVRPADSNMDVANLLHDVAAQIVADPGAITADQRRVLERMAPLDTWAESYRTTRCWSQNWQFDPAFRWDRLGALKRDVIGIWADLTARHPNVTINNRACVGAIAWSPFPVGPTYTVERSVAPNDDGLVAHTVSGGATRIAAELLADLDGQPAQSIAWRAPGWLMLAAASVAMAAVRTRRPLMLAVLLPAVAFVASVLPVVPSQDARYMFPALMFAALLLPCAWSRIPVPSDAAGRAADR